MPTAAQSGNAVLSAVRRLYFTGRQGWRPPKNYLPASLAAFSIQSPILLYPSSLNQR